MKITTEHRDVETKGIMMEREFTIDLGPHIMKVLSAMYTNVIEAVVREYLTNAADGMIAFGDYSKRPSVELILPTKLNSELIIKDYGIGMSFDQAWNVFTVYGRSTKNDSNAETGGFGIGAKSCFAYNGGSPVTVETIHDGIKHVFSAFVGENSMPKFVHISTEATKELSGVAIHIPIRKEDYQEVYRAAAKFVPYFTMPITVSGNSSYSPMEYSIRGNTWGLRASIQNNQTDYPWKNRRTYGNSPDIILVMGGVPYEVDDNELANIMSNNYESVQFIRACPLDIMTNVGTVDIVPSRDALMYTDKTKKTILALIHTFRIEFIKKVNEILNQAPSEWEAWKIAAEYQELYGMVSDAGMEWRNIELNPTYGIGRTFKQLKGLDSNIDFSVYEIVNTTSSRIIDTHDNESTDDSVFNIMPKNSRKPNAWIMINDMKIGGEKIARAYLHEKLVNVNRNTQRVHKYGHTPGRILFIKSNNITSSMVSKLFGEMPIDEILMASKLENVVRIPPSFNTKDGVVYRWGGANWGPRTKKPIGSGPYYYLPLNAGENGKWVYNYANHSSPRRAVENHTDFADDMGVMPDVLYGIKRKDIPNFDPAEWINFFEYLKTIALKYMETETENIMLHAITLGREDIIFAKVLEILKVSTPVIDDYLKEFNKITNIHQNGGKFSLIEVYVQNMRDDEFNKKVLKIKNGVKVKIPDFPTLKKNIVNKYPLLDPIFSMAAATYGNQYESPLQKHKKQLVTYILGLDK